MTEGLGPAAPGPDPDPERVAPKPERVAPEPLPEPEPPPEPAGAAPTPVTPPVESTRRLLGASFDLLTRTSDDMRRASFYIGLIVLGTVGPFAVASFALEIVSIHHTRGQMERLLAGDSVAGMASSPSSRASASSSPPSKARPWRRRSSVDGYRDGA